MFHENLQDFKVSQLPYFAIDFHQVFTVLFENVTLSSEIKLNLFRISSFKYVEDVHFGEIICLKTRQGRRSGA